MENCQGDFISIETPRIRKFYEKYSKKEYETPQPQMNNFLQLLTSPVEGHPLVKLQYMTLRHQDLINNHLENTMSALKDRKLSESGFLSNCGSNIKASSRSEVEGFSFDWDQPSKKLNFSNCHKENGSATKKPQNGGLQNFKRSANEQSRSLRDITAQVNNASRTEDFDMEFEDLDHTKSKDRDGGLEVRKRKRKSNQQLKILQAEFERDGFWGKDKILSMARITGLSESQVNNIYRSIWSNNTVISMGYRFTNGAGIRKRRRKLT